MKYLVMETNLAFAVVLDERGKFSEVPNLGYKVGEELDSVVLFESKATLLPRINRARAARLVSAACVCLAMLVSWRVWSTPVEAVRLHINPDVQLELNRFERVISAEGLNEDGKRLVESLKSYGRRVCEVSDSLADRAYELGYLEQDGKITVTVECEREERRLELEQAIIAELESHLADEIEVVADTKAPEPLPASDYGVSDYGETPYETTAPPATESTDYGNTPYESVTPYDDGETDYSASDYSASDYEISDYE